MSLGGARADGSRLMERHKSIAAPVSLEKSKCKPRLTLAGSHTIIFWFNLQLILHVEIRTSVKRGSLVKQPTKVAAI